MQQQAATAASYHMPRKAFTQNTTLYKHHTDAETLSVCNDVRQHLPGASTGPRAWFSHAQDQAALPQQSKPLSTTETNKQQQTETNIDLLSTPIDER
jgi:hypothetical protein